MIRRIPAVGCAGLAILVAAGAARGQVPSAVLTSQPDYSVMRFVLSSLDGHALPEIYVKHTVGLLAGSLGGIDEEHAWSRDLFVMVKADGKIRFDDFVEENDSIGHMLEERLRGAAAQGAFVPLPCGECDSLAIAVRIVHAAQPVAVPAYFEFQVEKPVRQRSSLFKPEYPPSLIATHTEGRVLAQFVVGVDGKAEMNTFRVLESTHPDFVAAIRKALPGLTYYPAEIGGKPVRQVVQQPFTFAIPSPDGPSPEDTRRRP
ncbi:MAG: hypothetical protein HOQ11_08075 [Gemmatimonadaceae bacterium]|nr:hypothetical protein [Gemmatimonadaceae bacterium]NUQ91341.1 hypothetical protein [Gemmatimonadaceae bacterium]NUR20758.1 hypothetical protein [Gemmatimonadaceae bacterium]NUS97349.1 hypothetical protein [Gemmatimonadaceae bacterium]